MSQQVVLAVTIIPYDLRLVASTLLPRYIKITVFQRRVLHVTSFYNVMHLFM